MCLGAIALPGYSGHLRRFLLFLHTSVATAAGCEGPGTTAKLKTQFVVVLQVVTWKGFQFLISGAGEVGCQGR